MRGDLSETSAADACRAIAGSGATGVLMVDGPDGTGTITLVDGTIAGATSPAPRARLGDRLVGAGFLAESALQEALDTQQASGGRVRLGALLVERMQVPRDAVRLFVQEQTLDALFELVRWRYGAFDFVAGTPAAVPEVPVVIRVDDALLEVARRHEQWEQLSEVIPDLEAVPVFRAQPTSAAASLEPDEFAVLASVDGERSVRGLASDLGYNEFELARIVYGLELLGVVEIRLPEDEIGSALDDAFAELAELPDPVDAVEEPADPGTEPADAADATPADLGFFAEPAPPPAADAEEVGDHDDRDDGRIVESELPDRLPDRSPPDVLRELRGLDGQVASDASDDARAEGATPEEDTAEPDAPQSPGHGARPRGTSGPRGEDEGDVAEFLRELSRLALDEEPDPAPERPRRPSTTPDHHHREDEGRKKRRGLFGR